MKYAHIAITGASRGLGEALVRSYLRHTHLLSISGRDSVRLTTSCNSYSCFPGHIDATIFDIRNHDELPTWLKEADKKAPLDQVIINAGVCMYPGEKLLDSVADIEQMMDTDATSAMVAAGIAAELMVPRGTGVIVLISSLAALTPLAACPAYSAAKAALRFYGLALGERLRSTGVRVCVVCPGYIDTPMTAALTGPKPFLWSADKAAAYIKAKVEGGATEVCFPFLPALAMRLLSLLPRRMRQFFFKLFTAS